MKNTPSRKACRTKIRLPIGRLAVVRSVFFTVPMWLLTGSPAHASDGPEMVQQLVGPSGHTVWQIVRPRVNAQVTDYPQIRFSPGTTVVVNATGCVNHGGKGRTTTRYADPAGDDADRFHHGQIAIPGAFLGLQFFKPAQPTVYTIPAGAAGGHLTLGYTDRNAVAYKDNGYESLDAGPLDQCAGVNEAMVTIDMSPTPSLPAAPASAAYTFVIESVVVQHLRSQHKDTDVVGAGVLINGTPQDNLAVDVGDWGTGWHAVSFGLALDHVAPTDRLNIGYTILNAGHPSAQQKATLVTGVVASVLSAVPEVGSLLGAVANGIGAIINLVNPDCDGPVVAGAIPATGADLFAWTQLAPPFRRTVTFPGVRSADGCGGDSFYQITYSIMPGLPDGASGIEPFSLQIDARTHVATAGRRATLLKHP